MARITNHALFTLATDSWQIAAEAALVIPLRMARIAQGGTAAEQETRRMVSEKIAAHGAIGKAISAGKYGTRPDAIAAGAARHYLRLVRANRQRLMSGR